jgi:hypothetical protein
MAWSGAMPHEQQQDGGVEHFSGDSGDTCADRAEAPNQDYVKRHSNRNYQRCRPDDKLLLVGGDQME